MKNLKSAAKMLTAIALFVILAALLYLYTPDLTWQGRLGLGIFMAAMGAWCFTKADATLVAVLAAFAMAAAGLTNHNMPLAGLGDPFIVFIVGGFMLGSAYKATGLSEEIAIWFARRSNRVSSLFYMLTAAMVILSFAIPSTSARAAILMPVYIAIANTSTNNNVKKALAVLFPTVIVLSCVISFLGAGANLMTADFIKTFTGETITYSEWFLLGAPFGSISCFFSTWVILRIFLTADERKLNLPIVYAESNKKTGNPTLKFKVLAISIAMICLWMTEQWHGIDAGLVAFGGVLILCLPDIGVISFKQAIKDVEWPLVVFMAATIELSQGLVQSGAVAYLTTVFSSGIHHLSGIGVLISILLVALLSHLIIHSRTARAAVLMPVLIPIGISAGYSGLIVAFFANAAMGYCLTLPVCAKPVALFSTADESYTSKDLMKLSTWLIPFHLVLLWIFCWVYGI